MIKRITLYLVISSFILFTFGCTSTGENAELGDSSAVETEDSSIVEVNVGVVLPMTGVLSSFGQMVWNGIEIASSTVSNGLKVNLILVDNESDKSTAVEVTKELIDSKNVVAIIGDIASSFSLAIGGVAEEKRVPMITPVSTYPVVTQGKRYVNRACFVDPYQAGAAAVFAYRKLGAKSAVIFSNDSQDYLKSLAEEFADIFQALGGDSTMVHYNIGETDFSTQVSEVIDLNPDIAYVAAYYYDGARIISQLRERGYTGYIMGGDGLEAPDFISMGGEAVEGVYITTHFHPDSNVNEISENFVREYRERFGEAPTALSALGFDAYLILLDSVKRVLASHPDYANDLQSFREALAVEIRKTKDFEGATGYITINENGDAEKTVFIEIVRDGNFEFSDVVNPSEIP